MEWFARYFFHYYKTVYRVDEAVFPVPDGAQFPEPWRKHLNLSTRDMGIDGLIRSRAGEFTAVQCKFRANNEGLSYKELGTFWADAEHAEQRLVFTNAKSITPDAHRRRGFVSVALEDLQSLPPEFWESLTRHFRDGEQAVLLPRKRPRPYQQRALNDLIAGLRDHPRGKLIAACGIGKTLISLWLAEFQGTDTVLVVAPNLQLIRQTLREWADQASEFFEYIAVCSDSSVALSTFDTDEVIDNVTGFDIPTTTDAKVVQRFLEAPANHRKLVLSTYHSLQVVEEGVRTSKFGGFDLGIFDEAHKTAGLDAHVGFGLGLQDEHIPIAKRLFMTATERLYSPRIRAVAEQQDRIVFSMDDEELYGPSLHRLSFSTAIDEGIISDYRIVVAVLGATEIRRILLNYDYLIDTDEDPANRLAEDAHHLLSLAIMEKVHDDLGAKKFVTYHSTVRDARNFAMLVNEKSREIIGYSVSGQASSRERAATIRAFEETESASLSNARVLVEGVNIPIIDSVYFVAAKSSLIDIVQALGRALRRPYESEEEKLAYVVIPVIVPEIDGEIDVSSSEFDRLYNVLQALRDQDDAVASEIDQLNLEVATGGSHSRTRLAERLRLLIPGELSVSELQSALMLRIAEVNARPTGSRLRSSSLGAGERVSPIARRVRTIGDYTPRTFCDSLVLPTLARFTRLNSVCARVDLKVNNNNVGHSEKLGLITSDGDGGFGLTTIGKELKSGRVDFDTVFRNQILIYCDNRNEEPTWPYRLIVETLVHLGQLSYPEFLFGPYAAGSGEAHEDAVRFALNRIEAVRNSGIDITVASEANQEAVLTELTRVTGVSMSLRDVFTDRTTTFNQFRYFRRHLELFQTTLEDRSDVLHVRQGRLSELQGLLSVSSRYLRPTDYGEKLWLT